MTVPFTEPVQNYTEFSLWEILDIKKANFSVSSFDELDEAYSETPLKFAERTIVQLGSTPKRIRYYDENGDFTEDDYYPSNKPEPYRDAEPMDHVESVGFDENKKARIDNPEDKRFMFVDFPIRLYNTGEVDIYLDSTKPIGAIQLENFCNYNWDYPELIIKIYVDNDQTYLGGFRIPYGFGVLMKYNLDNKSESNLSKGWWTWSMFGVDWSVINKVASIDGEFSSVSVAYNGLFGDEGDGDERVFYPAMTKQDENGWTQEEFTGNKIIRSKNKDTGLVGDKVLELQSGKVVHHKQPYYGDLKLQTRTNNPVYRTVSKNDLIGDDDKTLQEWITENTDYTPIEFVDRLFSSKVMGYTNWEASITLSNETFNGTLPLGYTQFRVFRTGGTSRSFMYLHNKESHTVLYAPYKSGVAPIFRKIAYTDEIESVVNDTLNDLVNPPEPDEVKNQYIFDDSHITKGYQNKHTAINPFSYDDEYNRISYDYRNETSSGPRNAFQILSIKDKSIGYMMIKEDRLKDMMSASGLYVPPNLQSVYGVRIPTGTIVRMGGTGSAPSNATNGGKYDYRGLAIPNTHPNTGAVIDPNRQSNDMFLDNDGNLITDMSAACSHFRTERNLDQTPLGNAGEDMNLALKRGVIIFKKDGDKSDAFFVEDGNSPWYIMTVELNTVASSTEQYTSVIYKNDSGKSASKLNLYPNPFIAALDGEKILTTTEATTLIETNNDEIIAPEKGTEFQIIDPEKTSSYGNASKQVTYFGPNEGTQSETLLTKLDYGKVFAIHEEVNTTKMIMIMHESLVAQIYNKDVTGINELTMLFSGDNRGRIAKSNQTADAQFSINWNGELIPSTDDPNALNPEHWVASDDSVTETWSTSVKSVCYTSGILANRGSAMLKRGDVIYSKPASLTVTNEPLIETPKHLSNSLQDSGERAEIVYDNASEFFVLPIFAGGGTFNVMKLFQLFMSRKYQTIENWGSFTFNESSDCIGTILKISYDAAIAAEDDKDLMTDTAQTELFKMAAATMAEYPNSNFVIKTGE